MASSPRRESGLMSEPMTLRENSLDFKCEQAMYKLYKEAKTHYRNIPYGGGYGSTLWELNPLLKSGLSTDSEKSVGVATDLGPT
ncbi:hypothetical protein K474DRAFT_1669923 [Panus rudis PR-1116 ss-1]|nr:hypothetical protein K474DRAFT_1669923 [Panus rudis PR-1116 ss-1]